MFKVPLVAIYYSSFWFFKVHINLFNTKTIRQGYKIMSNDVGWNSSQFPEKHLVCQTLEILAERSELWLIGWFHQQVPKSGPSITYVCQNPGQQLSSLSNIWSTRLCAVASLIKAICISWKFFIAAMCSYHENFIRVPSLVQRPKGWGERA